MWVGGIIQGVCEERREGTAEDQELIPQRVHLPEVREVRRDQQR